MQELELLIDAVTEAGRLATTLFRQSVRNWRKEDNSPVSDADLAVNRLLQDRLTGARPDYGWFSEESDDGPARLSASHVWVVDPIDGTRAFLKGGNQWCISVGLVKDGRPIAAVVYRPMTNELYAAVKGQGAKLNHLPLKTGTTSAVAGCRILGASGIARRLPGCEIMPAADLPLALRLCYVAQGLCDAFIAIGPKLDWDICAGQLLVEEAGGIVTDLTGQPCTYNREEIFQCGVIAANPVLHGECVRAMN